MHGKMWTARALDARNAVTIQPFLCKFKFVVLMNRQRLFTDASDVRSNGVITNSDIYFFFVLLGYRI